MIQLSIIYANRSACLYRLEDYDRAIADIQRALYGGYPKNLRYKVYDRYSAIGRIPYVSIIELGFNAYVCCALLRRARCLLATKQWKRALESFKTALEALDDSDLPLDERRKRRLEAQETLTIMADGGNLNNGMR